jgi:hypothetical protein
LLAQKTGKKRARLGGGPYYDKIFTGLRKIIRDYLTGRRQGMCQTGRFNAEAAQEAQKSFGPFLHGCKKTDLAGSQTSLSAPRLQKITCELSLLSKVENTVSVTGGKSAFYQCAVLYKCTTDFFLC